MQETLGLTNEDFLWAGFGLHGGISGEQHATCGAVAASVVYIGLRHRLPLSDTNRVAKARKDIEKEALGLAKEFIKKFGTTICIDLVKEDLSDPIVHQQFRALNITKDTCDRFVSFVIDKLYELEKKREAEY
jgi:hypothetical protein